MEEKWSEIFSKRWKEGIPSISEQLDGLQKTHKTRKLLSAIFIIIGAAVTTVSQVPGVTQAGLWMIVGLVILLVTTLNLSMMNVWLNLRIANLRLQWELQQQRKD